MPFDPKKVRSRAQVRKFFALGIGKEMTEGMTPEDHDRLPERVIRTPLQEAVRRKIKQRAKGKKNES